MQGIREEKETLARALPRSFSGKFRCESSWLPSPLFTDSRTSNAGGDGSYVTQKKIVYVRRGFYLHD